MSRPHGVTKYRQEGCRCRVCKDGNSAALREYRRRKAQQQWGMWEPWANAESVRRHVRALMAAGIGWQRIARTAGLSLGGVSRLLYGRPLPEQIRKANADKLLAVRVEHVHVTPRMLIDATGTRRRLQALVAVGWNLSQLAHRLGKSPTNMSPLINVDKIRAGTAEEVARLYDELWDAEPPNGSRAIRGQVTAAKKRAAREGWPPPMAWDDDTIDDPEAKPAGWQRRGDDRLEAYRELKTAGVSPQEAAERLGVSKRTIWRYEARLRDLEAAS